MFILCVLILAATLSAFAQAPQDVAQLREAAVREDLAGLAAPEAYQRLAMALERLAEHKSALERGLQVSLRDNDASRAEWFRERLPATARVSKTTLVAGSGVRIPGGRDALAFVAHARERSAPSEFLVDYARAIVENTRWRSPEATEYSARLRLYFKRIADLEALGTRKEGRVTLTIARNNKQSEKILNLLGWKMQSSENKPRMEAIEKTQRGSRQESSIALAVDSVAIQEALDSGKAFSFDLVSDWAPVVLSEDAWRGFYGNESLPGGLAEALALDPALAQAYAGLAALDNATSAALVTGIGMKPLVKSYGPLLFLYSSALAVDNQAVDVPGGQRAEPFWEKLAGVSPRRPPQFFQALFEKDNGRLLSFYFTIAHVDAAHQRFCTRSASRLAHFYEGYREALELQTSPALQARPSAWIEMMRAAPLDAQGRLRFPGGLRVWRSSGSAQAAGPVSDDTEDDSLLRLLKTQYNAQQEHHSAVENLNAIAHIDAHRAQPLSEAAAKVLYDNFAENSAAFPYFSTLTGLEAREFEAFFALRDKFQHLSPVERNHAVGQFHSLIELLCLARRSGALDDSRATTLFSQLCQRFAAADGLAASAAASLAMIREIAPGADPDGAVRRILLGDPSPVSFESGGAMRQLEPGKLRSARFQKVLEEQNAPSLTLLESIDEAARNLASGTGDAAAQLKTLDAAVAKLVAVNIPRAAPGRVRKNFEAFQPKRGAEIVAKLHRESRNRGQAESLRRELLADISPQVSAALAGLVYAYFLNPDDLLVSEDPLLVRKHQFVRLSMNTGPVFRESELVMDSSGAAGSYFMGGFTAFATEAGKLGSSDAARRQRNASYAVQQQIAAIRAISWTALRDEDLRLLGLKLRLAREWIVQVAEAPTAASELSDATLGVLSMVRRRALLNALKAQDWAAVWQAVSLSDLDSLADIYLRTHPSDAWQSPVTAAAREAAARNDGSRLEVLGPMAAAGGGLGCAHAHRQRFSPYEEYGRYFDGERMAARVSELNLYLADFMNSAGIPAAAFGPLAEPVAEIIFKRMRMTDSGDWRSVLAAYAGLNREVIEEALAGL